MVKRMLKGAFLQQHNGYKASRNSGKRPSGTKSVTMFLGFWTNFFLETLVGHSTACCCVKIEWPIFFQNNIFIVFFMYFYNTIKVPLCFDQERIGVTLLDSTQRGSATARIVHRNDRVPRRRASGDVASATIGVAGYIWLLDVGGFNFPPVSSCFKHCTVLDRVFKHVQPALLSRALAPTTDQTRW